MAGRLARSPARCETLILACTCLVVAACGGDRPPASREAHPLPPTLDPTTAAALRAARDAALADGASANDWLELGMIWHANGAPDQALACYAEAEMRAPTDPRAPHLAGLAAERLGKLDAALASFRRSGELAPSAAAPAWRTGLVLLDLGDVAGAEAAFRRASEIDAGDRHGSLGLARTYLATSQPQAALDVLAPILASNAHDPHARHLAGTALRQLGQWDQARLELLRAGGRRAEWSDPWMSEMLSRRTGFAANAEAGLAALEAGDFPTALAVFTELHRRQPGTAHVLTNLSLALESSGRVDEAAKILETAVIEQPALASLRVDLARVRLRQGRGREALAEAVAAAELDPRSAQAHLMRGVALDAAGREREAIMAFAEATRLDPRPGEVLVKAGKLELQLGLTDAARVRFEDALAADPDAADAGLGLAILALGSGDMDRAATALVAAERAGATPESVGAVRTEMARRRAPRDDAP